MKKVAASILGSKTPKKLVSEIIDNSIGMIHYDHMDGVFVPATSLSMPEIKEIVANTPEHIVDIHLMCIDPIKKVEEMSEVADYITLHIEAIKDNKELKYLFDKFKNNNIGLSINPSTNVSLVKDYLKFVSHILVMSVNPGRGNQKFIENSLNKIKELARLRSENNYDFFIQVDGGINNETGPKCMEFGSDSLVSGSYLTKNLSSNIEEKITGQKKD